LASWDSFSTKWLTKDTFRKAICEDGILLFSVEEGLRDYAATKLILYIFGRVSAVIAMKVKYYFPRGTIFIRLYEKGEKYHEAPAHLRADF
jgi:hypothetical protein